MPRPTEAQYDWATGYLTFHVEPSSLKLLAKVSNSYSYSLCNNFKK